MRVRSIIASAVASIAVIITASGCTPPPATVPIPNVPVVAQRYMTLEAVRDAAVQNGFTCDTWTVTRPGRAGCGLATLRGGRLWPVTAPPVKNLCGYEHTIRAVIARLRNVNEWRFIGSKTGARRPTWWDMPAAVAHR